jgi:hypothetical protein
MCTALEALERFARGHSRTAIQAALWHGSEASDVRVNVRVQYGDDDAMMALSDESIEDAAGKVARSLHLQFDCPAAG